MKDIFVMLHGDCNVGQCCGASAIKPANFVSSPEGYFGILRKKLFVWFTMGSGCHQGDFAFVYHVGGNRKQDRNTPHHACCGILGYSRYSTYRTNDR